MSSHRRTRVILVGLVVLVGAALTAIFVPRAGPAEPAQPAASPLAGPFAGPVDIGAGRVLFLRCLGQGPVTVLLESGAHDSSDAWTVSATAAAPVIEEVGRYTHVCAYDRPGTVQYVDPPALTTRSTPVVQPRTLENMAADLGALLASARIPGPYVLVGHSLGGLVIHLYAQQQPDAVAGLVFVDTLAPALQGLLGDQWLPYTRLVNYPGTALKDLYTPQWETIDATAAVATVTANPALPKVPTAVLSKGEPFEVSADFPPDLVERLEQAWSTAQQSRVAPGSDTPHTVATGSGHNVHQNAPDLVSATIRLVLDRSRQPATPTSTG